MITNLLDYTVDTPILAMSLDLWEPTEMQHFFTYSSFSSRLKASLSNSFRLVLGHRKLHSRFSTTLSLKLPAIRNSILVLSV